MNTPKTMWTAARPRDRNRRRRGHGRAGSSERRGRDRDHPRETRLRASEGSVRGRARGRRAGRHGKNCPRQRDGRIDGIERGLTESRWVEKQLGRPVVKAFNNIYADHLMNLGKPKGESGRVALPVAGDDARAKSVVMKLVDEVGFDPVDAGGLDESWRQQPGSPVYTKDFDADTLKRGLALAKPERRAEWRATDGSPGSYASPA